MEEEVKDVFEIDEQPQASDEQSQQDEQPQESEKPVKQKKHRKKLTKEQKQKRLITGLSVTGAILLVLAIFVSGVAIGNVVGTNALLKQARNNFEKVQYTEHEQIAPQRDENGWFFEAPSDREFKVVQFTDVHIGGGCFSQKKDTWAMNAVATMIRQEQPDLVIITGDIAYPVPFQAGTFNNLSATKIFSNMMESLGVYWTFAFGNHDTEAYSMYSRREICEWYEEQNFEYCLFERGFSDDDDKFGKIDRGFGNHIINLKNSAGKYIKSFVIYDSHSYTDGDYFGMAWKYDNIHQSQVDWYNEQMDNLKKANKDHGFEDEYVKNLVFFHIPLMEYREAWKAVKNTLGAAPEKGATALVPASDAESKQDGQVVYYYGKMGEAEKTRNGVQSFGIFCGYKTDRVFEEGLTHNMQGIFCGHDHYNNFSIEYKGIRLTYGMSVDYLAYPGIFKEHSQRGCTTIEVSESAFNVTPKNYYDDYKVAFEAK